MPSFTISGTAVTVARGAATGNTSTITVTPSGSFTGAVALTASITAGPAGGTNAPTLSFGSTSSVNVSSASASTATLTISTTATSSAASSSANKAQPRRGPWYAAGGAALAGILLCGLPFRRRRWQATLGVLMLSLALLTGVLACGSSTSSGGGGGGIGNPGTTPGTYTITVTGTAGSLTQSGTVTLVVN